MDKRTDVWAFGVVLYQMLSGETCFGGDTVTDILAAIVREEPDWEAVAEPLPPRLRQLLDRMLDKDPRKRLRDMGEARIAIEGVLDGEPAEMEPVSQAPQAPVHRWWPLAVGAAVLALAAAGGTWWLSRTPSVELPLLRFAIQLEHGDPGRAAGFDPRLSPDGRHIVFVSRGQL